MECITRTRIDVPVADIVSSDRAVNRPFFVSQGTVLSVSALAVGGDARSIVRNTATGISFRLAHESQVEVIDWSTGWGDEDTLYIERELC